jgi:hypothetical protein
VTDVLQLNQEVRIITRAPGSVQTAYVVSVSERFVRVRYYGVVRRVLPENILYLGVWPVVRARDLDEGFGE